MQSAGHAQPHVHVYDDVTYVCDDVTGTQSAGHAQPRRSPVRLCDTECVLHRMCSLSNVLFRKIDTYY